MSLCRDPRPSGSTSAHPVALGLAALLCWTAGCGVDHPIVTHWHGLPATVPDAGSAGDGLLHNAAPLGNSRLKVTTTPVSWTVVTDPDHDSVWAVPADGNPPLQIELAIGEEPGDIQLVSTAMLGTVAYVSVHNGGAILAIPLVADTTAPLTSTRIPVCESPRGLDAFTMPSGETLFIACADGALMSLDVATNTIQTTLPLPDDLKDVVVMDDTDALVTRFRSAEVLVVNLQTGTFLTASLSSFSPPGSSAPMIPDVAWQMIPFGGLVRRGAVIVHQLAATAVIDVVSQGVPDAGFGGFDGGTGDCSGAQQGYGPSPCSPTPECNPGVVASAVSVVLLPQDDQAPSIIPVSVLTQLPPLTISEATTPGFATFPGSHDDMAIVASLGDSTFTLVDLTTSSMDSSSTFACFSGAPSGIFSGASSLGPASDGNPGVSVFIRQQGAYGASVAELSTQFILGSFTALPNEPIQGEEGRNLFHQPTPSMMSCASCHPNGRDDGHIWNFNPMGLRRTPALGGGLLATAPFHWDGAEANISQLMSDVFVGRMEGTPPTDDQVTAISDWLNGLPEARATAAPDPDSAAAGKVLFESTAVGCTTCHTGEHFTNNLTLNVGTGGSFQVPSLLGVASRPPYLHDGRAATLEDRFDPSLGGGDLHGHTSQLSTAEIEFLCAYLRSL